MPSTSGGRAATVNTGTIELAFWPLSEVCFPDPATPDMVYAFPSVWINLALPNAPIPPTWQVIPGSPDHLWYQVENEPVFISQTQYRLMSSWVAVAHAGTLNDLLDWQPTWLAAARDFTIKAMRQNQSSMFRRWNSRPLVTEALSASSL